MCVGINLKPGRAQEGSALFVAPEVMQDPLGVTHDGRGADVFSCSIILYILCYGRHPYLRAEVRVKALAYLSLMFVIR